MRTILVMGVVFWTVFGILLTPFAFGMALSCLVLLGAERMARSATRSVEAVGSAIEEQGESQPSMLPQFGASRDALAAG